MAETFRLLLDDQVKFDKFVKDALKKVDSDESGSIDKKELLVILTEISYYIGSPAPKEEDLKAVFNFLDTDHSNVIELEEFKILIKDILTHIVSKEDEVKLTKISEGLSEKAINRYKEFIEKFSSMFKTNVFGNIYPLSCFCSAIASIFFYLSEFKAINFDSTALSASIFFGGLVGLICGGIDFAFNREFSAFSNITGGMDFLVYQLRDVLNDMCPNIEIPSTGAKRVYTVIWVAFAIFFAVAAKEKGTLLISIKYYIGILVSIFQALHAFSSKDIFGYLYGGTGFAIALINFYLGCVSIVNLEYGRDVLPV